MINVESIKRDMKAMQDLEDLTNMLEQTAARTIAQMRKDIVGSREYFREVWRVYGILKKLAPLPPEVVHKHLVVGIGIDWGMPGALLNKVMSKVSEEQALHESDLLIAGKRSHSRFRNKTDHTTYLFSAPKNATLANIRPIYKVIAGYARVTIVYPSFESLSKQTILTASFSMGGRGIDDVNNPASEKSQLEKTLIDPGRFVIDPDPQSLVNYLDEAIVGVTVHHYFSESILAYSAAQMVSMRNGHDNAKQEGKSLLIKYHRARREQIDNKIRELQGSEAKDSIYSGVAGVEVD